ncbi:MAG: hypothetical protein JO370_00460 [Paucibacter sp.]|nr:hypothetical protein [Roseateles sp.]
MNAATAFESFRPEDEQSYGFWLTASIGANDSDGADLFQVFICSRQWRDRAEQGGQVDRCLVLDGTYDYGATMVALNAWVDGCSGGSWSEIVSKLSAVGAWEYEGYRA